MPSKNEIKIRELLSQLPQFSIDDPKDIKQIVDLINRKNDFINNSDASWLTVGHCGFIKCFSPSLDYPCIPHPYYLYPPFVLSWSTPLNKISNHLYFPTPILKCSEQQGEKDSVLTFMKDSLIYAIVNYFQIKTPHILLD
ncbi:hypothetical protein A2574_02680 [Candidatus Shapirobacteria bacterium RIFOXYD1_FULL_38_32]|uniref:Uncharacterized protein n=3 Tax=Candidatus Shapironibacteriota TaxID=1752721 RepID=A0A0G0K8F4_9BACT|nr:MAG: hypothetical protein US90_C0001G0065 [Candidatus Shapirobacteria bacterium GW2011_GWE2_38_30]KKQ89969.1 MAG: hypothetical protein UT14_C0047G0006 [Candidatus Shapirobacteria bacterium GW2011_GWE1_38_92]OGL56433.1 MAG: hypothetical protein A2195_03345 [Candidatus Shapirobacteria bacterium RIFOXYA1_FULL_39_17]OGL57052.1 MAG: hypothetical protein A2367_01970 [Candidatus Shapirobacteria bacterium RIFOXYB1_FULL_38_38]OGL57665.1 MAG: hypothetical protein A2574_02680 [Candidatus Shapirobacteri